MINERAKASWSPAASAAPHRHADQFFDTIIVNIQFVGATGASVVLVAAPFLRALFEIPLVR